MTDTFNIGILEQLLQDPDISEIMVNGTANIYIEKRGRLIETDLAFESEHALMEVIKSIVTSVGRTISQASPIVDARLADGSRVNAVIRPIAVSGPALTLRKIHKEPLTVEQLIGFGSWTQKTVDFLQACIAARINTVVSGGTSSGKTTIFNILSGFIPENERLVTVEATTEIQMQHPHVVVLEARPSTPQGEAEVTLSDLITNATRMRPNRIIAGEVNGGEVWDMLGVMTSGYDGSMFTMHAIDVHDALDRIEMWCIGATNLPVLQIRSKIAQGIGMIVQQNRMQDGTRKITRISEVIGLHNSTIATQDILHFIETPEGGEARFTGYIPTFTDRLDLPDTFFFN